MSCRQLCGHPLKRFHFSCLYCRHRRMAKGDLKEPDYYKANLEFRVVKNPRGRLVFSRNGSGYFLAIDGQRRFAHAKGKLLKKVLELAEFLAN